MNKLKSFAQNGVSFTTFAFSLALYFTVVVNIPVYKELYGIFNQLDAVKVGFALSIPFFFFGRIQSSVQLIFLALGRQAIFCFAISPFVNG